MDFKKYRALVAKVAEKVDGVPLREDASGVDLFWPILERMRQEGAVVLLKLDGGRNDEENGPYTAVVSGRPLKGAFFRTDAYSIEEALAYIIVEYARLQWHFSE